MEGVEDVCTYIQWRIMFLSGCGVFVLAPAHFTDAGISDTFTNSV